MATMIPAGQTATITFPNLETIKKDLTPENEKNTPNKVRDAVAGILQNQSFMCCKEDDGSVDTAPIKRKIMSVFISSKDPELNNLLITKGAENLKIVADCYVTVLLLKYPPKEE